MNENGIYSGPDDSSDAQWRRHVVQMKRVSYLHSTQHVLLECGHVVTVFGLEDDAIQNHVMVFCAACRDTAAD